MSKHRHFTNLDSLRSAAAMLVVIEHVRSLTFHPFSTSGAQNSFLLPFYAITSLGKEAVLIFFVLSGYLVGGQAIRKIRTGSWSLTEYGIKRLSRLWIVLLPALLLTLILDQTLVYLGYGSFLNGSYPEILGFISSLPTNGAPASHDGAAFFGNLFFLQTIFVPTYGSNGPLWSLSYEFWYYVAFPAVLLLFFRKSILIKFFSFSLIISVILITSTEIQYLFLIWTMGAASAYIGQYTNLHNKSKMLCVTGLILITSSIVLVIGTMSIWEVPHYEIIIGAYVCFSIFGLNYFDVESISFRKNIRFFADSSYSLYLTHFPVILFISASFGLVRPDRLLYSMLHFVILTVASILVSILFWYLFERHTNTLAKTLLGQRKRPRAWNSEP